MIVLTFDTDHMTERMMDIFIDRIMPPDITATYFCSRPFASLRGAKGELAPHPVLEPSRPWLQALQDKIREVEDFYQAEVEGLRTHSLVSSQQMMVQLNTLGLSYVSSIAIPYSANIAPFRGPWGVVEIPIRYMDNMDLWARDKTGLQSRCFDEAIIELAMTEGQHFCFDFHPIHIMLNTAQFADYETWVQRGRPELDDLVKRRCYGTRDFFLDLCAAIRRAGREHVTCATIARRIRGLT
jgi:hypothetical protein